ncbi:hypothetical protein TARUN_7375 [Trichoderma arundinaceum]|uniref:Uncharacterized protein n=1 Tax=Trichoderma arundinaceum TaxID=490622 RepID=A0A395NFY4_TRIAR|nr:hypothetical protein TARUN_7375 [Trichoderma arundinaceum]
MENRGLIDDDAVMHLVEGLISGDALANSTSAPPFLYDPLLADRPPDYPGPQTGAPLTHTSTQNSRSVATGSGTDKAKNHVFCCFQQKCVYRVVLRDGALTISSASPCLWCAFRLQDGDYTARCRRDVEIRSENCIECVYTGRKCTWGGYEPDPDFGTRLVEDRKTAAILASEKGVNSEEAQSAISWMRRSAAKYLVSFWEKANILDMFTGQCRHSLPTPKKKKRKLRSKGKDADKVSNKEANNDAEAETTEAYSRTAMRVAQIFLLRQILKSNNEVAAVVLTNYKALEKILSASQEGVPLP